MSSQTAGVLLPGFDVVAGGPAAQGHTGQYVQVAGACRAVRPAGSAFRHLSSGRWGAGSRGPGNDVAIPTIAGDAGGPAGVADPPRMLAAGFHPDSPQTAWIVGSGRAIRVRPLRLEACTRPHFRDVMAHWIRERCEGRGKPAAVVARRGSGWYRKSVSRPARFPRTGRGIRAGLADQNGQRDGRCLACRVGGRCRS